MSKFSKIVICILLLVMIIVLVPTISFTYQIIKFNNRLNSNDFAKTGEDHIFPGIYCKTSEDDVRVCVEPLKYNIFSAPQFGYTEMYTEEIPEKQEDSEVSEESEKTDETNENKEENNFYYIHLAFQINSLSDDSKNNVLIVHSRTGIEKKIPITEVNTLSINDLNLPEEEMPTEEEFNENLQKDISDIKAAYNRAINLFK